jgi:hypothetical protein
MKEIKQLTEPKRHLSEETAFEAFKQKMHNVNSTVDDQFTSTISFLKQCKFDDDQLHGLKNIKNNEHLLQSSIIPLQTLCFQYDQANQETRHDIKARFNNKTFTECIMPLIFRTMI